MPNAKSRNSQDMVQFQVSSALANWFLFIACTLDLWVYCLGHISIATINTVWLCECVSYLVTWQPYKSKGTTCSLYSADVF